MAAILSMLEKIVFIVPLCSGEELNLHGITPIHPSSVRVYQFRHPSIIMYIYYTIWCFIYINHLSKRFLSAAVYLFYIYRKILFYRRCFPCCFYISFIICLFLLRFLLVVFAPALFLALVLVFLVQFFSFLVLPF